MNEWKAAQKADNLTFIPDGNAEFTQGMGMLVDKSDLGFGKRSWRYSMLVRDGVVEKMFIEPGHPGDPYEVSDAQTMLNYLNPNANAPDDVVILTKKGCPFCARAKRMLLEHGFEYEELTVNEHISGRALRAVASAESVPQIFIDGQRIGGSDELAEWLDESKAA